MEKRLNKAVMIFAFFGYGCLSTYRGFSFADFRASKPTQCQGASATGRAACNQRIQDRNAKTILPPRS